MKKKVLWVGDSPDCPSGFGRATREILDRLRFEYDVAVLGINYRGDPHPYPYPVYTALIEQEPFGTRRLHEICKREKPDVIVLQNDGWNIPGYIQMLLARKKNGEYHFPEHAAIPVVAAVPVDGKNFQGEWLHGVALTIFWTQFALDEARAGGFAGFADVIPLGVDLSTYHPVDRDEAITRLKLDSIRDKFIVGNVNRNQPRKRWDLTIEYFAEWVKTYKIKDAYLFLHAAPTGDAGISVIQLAKYHGVLEMLALRDPDPYDGISEEQMRDTYNCFNIDISTTQGEGFGLTTLEAMACGVPCIVPDWSALGDWAKRGAWEVPCTSTCIGSPFVNVIGGVPDKKQFVLAMQRLYLDKKAHTQNSTAALECAKQPQFRWGNIGERWVQVLDSVLATPVERPWQDAGRPLSDAERVMEFVNDDG